MRFFFQIRRWWNVCMPFAITYWYMSFLAGNAIKYFFIYKPSKALLMLFPDDVYKVALFSIIFIVAFSLGRWHWEYCNSSDISGD